MSRKFEQVLQLRFSPAQLLAEMVEERSLDAMARYDVGATARGLPFW